MDFGTIDIRFLIHYGLHFLAIAGIAWGYDRHNWLRAWGILLLTMLVDLDHLLAWPDVFVPDRCSIGFHLLHQWWAIGLYVLGALFWQHRTGRLICIGLLFHMLTDGIDCYLMELGW